MFKSYLSFLFLCWCFSGVHPKVARKLANVRKKTNLQTNIPSHVGPDGPKGPEAYGGGGGGAAYSTPAYSTPAYQTGAAAGGGGYAQPGGNATGMYAGAGK